MNNYENHEDLRILLENHENHENDTDPYDKHEIIIFFRISLENQKNYEMFRI